MNIAGQAEAARGSGSHGFDLAQPPGGYGPPPGGAPPGGWGPPPGAPPGGGGGGWGPPGGGPPGGAPPGGWGPPGGAPPGGGPPGGGNPPGGWGPPGGPPPGGAPPGWGGGYGPPPGGYGQPPGPPGGPPGGYGPPPGYPPGPPGYAPPAGTGGRPTFSPGDAITFAWERVKADPGTILGGIIVALLISTVVSFTISFAFNLIGVAASVATSAAVGAGRHRLPDPTALPFAGLTIVAAILHLVSLVINFAVSAFFTSGIAKFSLKVAKGEPYAFGDVFSGGQYFLSVLVVNILNFIAVSLGLVLLIVPGIIVAIGLSMSVPLVVDRNRGPIEALGESWKITDGSKANLFIFWLIAVGLGIAGVCACGVGLLLVMPILCIAWFYIYLRLTGQPVAAVSGAAAFGMSASAGYGAPPLR